MRFTVRRAEGRDAAAIAVCLATLGYATPPALVAEKLSALMGNSSDTVLVAEDPTAGIVGVVSVHLVPLFHAAGNLARLTALAVVPRASAEGCGSRPRRCGGSVRLAARLPPSGGHERRSSRGRSHVLPRPRVRHG